MKKQNYQLRIVITQGKEVLAEVKMRRDTLEDLPNVPSLPGTIYNMIGDRVPAKLREELATLKKNLE